MKQLFVKATAEESEKRKKQIEDENSKRYLLLLEFNDEVQAFEFRKGRIVVYDYLKMIVDELNLEKSYIVSADGKIDQKIYIHEFLKFVSDSIDDTFDVKDYIKGDL